MKGVPRASGVYLFRDVAGKVLYVGKARDLRKRLTQYRRPGGDGRLNILFLEQDAHSVETIVTRTEQEALLLEDTLIKDHKPRHNVSLKDDKSFLMVRIDLAERFPRLKLVRAHRPDEGRGSGRRRLFGPFASASSVRRTLADLQRVVPLRDCPDTVMMHRSRPCLQHQLGLCSAPCVDLIQESEYAGLVQRAAKILSGDVHELERDLDDRMRRASKAREYEKAAGWRDRLQALRRTVEGQGVRPKDRVVRDVLGLARRGDDALVYRLAFREGRLAESRSHRFRSILPDEELMHVVLTALYAAGRRVPPEEIVLPCTPAELEFLEGELGAELKLIVPLAGDRLRTLDMAGENARRALEQAVADEDREGAALSELVNLLDLDPETGVIDCFDVSNTQGAQVVASRVRFRRGHADRAGYRRFRVRSVDGQDDFESMHEVVLRSLRRGVQEGDLPDLVVVDGGPAQLGKALQAREEAGAFGVAMIGLAKARRARTVKGRALPATEERVFLPDVSEPIELDRHSAARLLLERIRDEAHRFAITYHRKERGRVVSRLDGIRGVGEVRRKALLRRFGSVAGVAAASIEELAGVRGVDRELARRIAKDLAGDPKF